MKLTAQNVEAVFAKCVADEFKADQEPGLSPPIQGVLHRTQFWLAPLRQHHSDIDDMLDGLPSGFHEGKGGGWSFLQACMDRDGGQWTGLHSTMEKLFMLGLAIGRVREPEPFASMRADLPGGMPYYVIARRQQP